MSLVELLDVDKDLKKIKVSGIDLVDGTPLLDIKPYIYEYDSILSRQPSWVTKSMEPPLEVSWHPETLTIKNKIPKDLQLLIEESLAFDIRNQTDKEKPNKLFKVLIGDWDISFTSYSGQLEIVNLAPLSSHLNSIGRRT